MEKNEKKAVLVLFAVITGFYLSGQVSFRLPTFPLAQLIAIAVAERSTPYSEEMINSSLRQPEAMIDGKLDQAIERGQSGFSQASAGTQLLSAGETELEGTEQIKAVEPDEWAGEPERITTEDN